MSTSREAENLLFAERDRPLTEAERRQLEQLLAAHPELNKTRATLSAAAEAWRARTTAIPTPDSQRAWQDLQRTLRQSAAEKQKRWPALLAWSALPLAAAAALVLTFSPTTPATVAPSQLARADFVEAGDANASTVVYVDQESGWLIVWASSPS